MVKTNKSTATSAAATTGSATSEVDPEARKDKMAQLAEEADAQESESLASANTKDDEGHVDPRTIAVPKPGKFDLNKFKSKRADAVANVETLQTGLPVHSMSQAKDFVLLYPGDDCWSPELCFVMVPIKGAKRDSLHLISEDLAMRFLPSGKVQRFRLALASKPHDAFFLCRIPTRNLDNPWNRDIVAGCEQAKALWTQATSRGEEGVDAYLIQVARDPDAFPEPKWPEQSLSELIDRAFAGRTIDSEDHPALLRLIGAKQAVS